MSRSEGNSHSVDERASNSANEPVNRELLRDGKKRLEAADINPIDAELLLAHLLGVGRMDLHAREFSFTSEEESELRERFDELIDARISSTPVQYLTGEAAFRHITLAVGPGVLIPRPETEGLVELALIWLEREHSVDPMRRFSVVDLGSGSGAIAIAIAVEARERGIPLSVVAVEDSTEAKPWLERNIATYIEKYDESIDIRLIHLPVKAALLDVRCDLVIANPPYIPAETELPADVRNEPDRALFGGIEGIEMPIHFIEHGSRLLKSGGALFMEHFEGQGERLARFMNPYFSEILGHDDLTGRGRYISARKK
jgi:release factor glutamine methyltransferase